ncbi:MAG: kelch repeat-containing protein [Ferruginibacter sp.]
MKKSSQCIACAHSQILRSWITLFILFFSCFCFAQADTWQQQPGGGGIAGTAGFSIGSKGYIAGANFWEFDPSTNTWTQKADYGGGGEIGFSIGTKGYILNGGSTDFWEYDPATNVWSKKADFAGAVRWKAVGFSIGNKGYVGTGTDGSFGFVGIKKDFWEFDPATNTWAQKADFSGTARESAIGFSIGNKGYIGTGASSAVDFKNDFWEFDPATNTWTQKADFGGTPRSNAVGFSVKKRGYIGTGFFRQVFGGLYQNIQLLSDFWEYDPYTNTWSQKASLSGSGRFSANGFSIGSYGYLGFGSIDGGGRSQASKDECTFCPVRTYDWWKYTPTPENENSITTTIASTTLSPGSSVGVKFLPAGSFNENSFFTAQLSDPTGDFATSVSIGNQRGYGSGIIKAIIPANTIQGNTYRIRVVSSDPDFTGTENGKDLTIIKPQPNTWVQKADFSGKARDGGTAFSIGNKGYFGIGMSDPGFPYDLYFHNDFWEYDPSIDAWTQKADFAGGARYNAVGFSIGNKGYVGTGNNRNYGEFGIKKDFWEYDPATNTWTQKADFGGAARYQATGFSIGSKGYIGTGWTDSGQTNDFWEYNPVINTWTQKADFGGTARELATGFSIGSKGYIGNGFVPQNDFWEYDPETNTWTQKADFGGGMRYKATGFSIGSKGYIGTGNNSSGDNSSLLNDFWEYNPSTNTWTKKADFGGVPRALATGFSIGSKGYIGVGNSDWSGFSLKNDWWEYTPTPENENSITTTIASTTLCTGSPVEINFLPIGSFNENSFFTAQLSDPSGNFAKAVSIGKLSGFGTGIIKAIIPFNTIPGNTYRIRVVSNNPTFAGSNNGANITINQGPVLTSTITAPAICNNTVFEYTASAIPAGTYFSWSRPVVAGIANPAANSTVENTAGTINEKLINTRTAPVIVGYNYLLNNNGCTNIPYKVTVTVKPSPLVKTKNITVYLNENGVVTITPKQVDNGSVSYCGSLSYSLDKLSFNCSNTGVNKVKLTVKDCVDNASTGNACVTVKDNMAPVITDANACPAILWPPNHSMRNVNVNYSVKDNCCVASTAITVTSNEPPVNNETDWIVVDKHHLQLRADRTGNCTGRVYTITISAKDVSGNSSTKVVTVTVPPNKYSAKAGAAIVGFDAAANGLSVQAMPNPSQHYFTLITKSNSNAPIAVSVTDAAGKLIEVRNNVAVKGRLELGNRYRPGTYYVQVIQGNNKATVMLVKQGN